MVVISNFTVKNGMEEGVREAFVALPYLVDAAPGFCRIEVIRHQGKPEKFWLVTWWPDEASYETWHHSHAHHNSNQYLPKGLKLVPLPQKFAASI